MQRFGPYLIERELSRGGQGVVYAARHEELGTQVALKLLLDRDPRPVARFRQEAQTLSRLEHPGVVKARDMGLFQGQPFLALDLVEGEDLKQSVQRGGVFAPAEAARIISKVAAAVGHCHEHGVVHRDLKPANVILERRSGEPVVVDFGLLKQSQAATAERLSLTGETKGTPAFMAPEQADPEFGEVGPASDVYALGATLFFLLSGRAPLEGATRYNLLVRLLKDPPPDLRDVRPEIPAEWAKLCMRAMSKRPEERYPSAAAFAEALERAAAQPGTSSSRAKLLTLAALGALAAAGGLALLASRSPDVSDAEAAAPAPTPVVAISPPSEPAAEVEAEAEVPEAAPDPAVLLQRFKAQFARGDFAQALAEAEHVVERWPARAEGHAARGAVLVAPDRLGEAEEAFSRSLAAAPRDVKVLATRGTVRLRSRDFRGAISDYTAAIALEPRGVFYLDRAMACKGMNDLRQAHQDLDRALALDQGLLQAWVERGQLNGRRGKHPAARSDAQRALRLDPDSFPALLVLLDACRGLRDSAGSLAGGRRAHAAPPAGGSHGPRDLRGRALSGRRPAGRALCLHPRPRPEPEPRLEAEARPAPARDRSRAALRIAPAPCSSPSARRYMSDP